MSLKHNIQYRPDIDGLRALAVLSVIIFHYNSTWLPGGFLGVDIFFVISGYLITSIIQKQLRENRFTFKNFYTRRIKRILPLLFTVLFVTIIPAIFILLPHDFESFTRSIRYAMQFRANRAFMGSDYFDLFAEEKPLLHLWSLAIEEQFYFIWPLLFVIAFFLTRRLRYQPYILFFLAIAGIIASTVAAEFSISVEPADSYYLLQNRAAELLVGCTLALMPFGIHQKLKTPVGTIGLVIVLLCFVFYSETTAMPGIYALIPTIAAAFFILDSNLESPYKKFFQLPAIRTIGLWSFSLYLWHWPFLAFSRYLLQSTEIPLSWLFFITIATFACSITTYYLIENPVRKTKFNLLTSILLIFIIPYGIVTVAYTVADRYIQNNPTLQVDFDQFRWFSEVDQCHADELIVCRVGNASSKMRYLLVGDSHAMHLVNMMNVIGKKENIAIDLVTPPGCAILVADTPFKSASRNCAEGTDFFLENFENYDAVILTQYFLPNINGTTNIPNYLEKLDETLQFVSQKKPLIVIADVPELGFDPLRNERLRLLEIEPFKTQNAAHQTQNIKANNDVRSLVEKIPNATFINILPLVDQLLEENQPIYRDPHHLSPIGSTLLGDAFIKDHSLDLEVLQLQQKP